MGSHWSAIEKGGKDEDAPNQVIEKKLAFLEDIWKLVPWPTCPGMEGKPEMV